MEFQICLHFCVSFLGRKKAVERSGRTNLQSQTYYNHWWGSFPSHCPSPPSQPPCPRLFFFLSIVVLSALPQSSRQLLLPEVTRSQPLQRWQGHISSLTSRCSLKPHYTSTLSFCHSARPCGNKLSNTKDGTLKKKNPYREPDHVYALDKGMGAGRMAWKEMCRAEFHGLFFSFWFIQRLLCVGYSKPSILPHPGGKSSELHAWVVLHLTAAIQ